MYLNEFATFPAQWLKNYFKESTVDERSISEVQTDDLAGFTQCHFFVGIGGWPIALKEAGWPEDVPVWTGSCPCQPFSAAGLGKGISDDRHLWPEFFRLIKTNRPPHIFGEQVSGRKVTGKLFTPRSFKRLKPEDRRKAEEADAEAWFKHVQTDLERIGYVVGHCVFPAAGVGAPHARQRLYWYARYVGNTSSERLEGRQEQSTWEECPSTERAGRKYQRVGDSETHRHNGQSGQGVRQEEQAGGHCIPGGVADMQRNEEHKELERSEKAQRKRCADEPCGCRMVIRSPPTNGHWKTADWVYCRDGKWRPVEPGSSPLAYGILSRASKISAGIRWLGYGTKTFKAVLRESKAILKAARDSRNGQLAGYGNAIVLPQAVEFIRACMEE